MLAEIMKPPDLYLRHITFQRHVDHGKYGCLHFLLTALLQDGWQLLQQDNTGLDRLGAAEDWPDSETGHLVVVLPTIGCALSYESLPVTGRNIKHFYVDIFYV